MRMTHELKAWYNCNCKLMAAALGLCTVDKWETLCSSHPVAGSVHAVTDMFFDYPFDLDANDQKCVQRFGIHSQYNWAASK